MKITMEIIFFLSFSTLFPPFFWDSSRPGSPDTTGRFDRVSVGPGLSQNLTCEFLASGYSDKFTGLWRTIQVLPQSLIVDSVSLTMLFRALCPSLSPFHDTPVCQLFHSCDYPHKRETLSLRRQGIGSDGRLTLSGWLLNQLDSPGFAWRTKNLLFTARSVNQAEWCCKRKNHAKYRSFKAL